MQESPRSDHHDGSSNKLVEMVRTWLPVGIVLSLGGLAARRRPNDALPQRPDEDGKGESEHADALVRGNYTYASLTRKINAIPALPLLQTPLLWLVAFGMAGMLTVLFIVAVTMLFIYGVGIWGINIPVAWGFAITNFVWWIGIGHAGTLISAILLLLRQHWRNSINRLAEAMTLFAVACAAMFPILHLGRPWLFYWLVPYPNRMGLWPQFRSPLTWDVFAITTYGLVSLLFWLVGLLPDLASMRDQATSRPRRIIFGILALGWRGSARHWQHYESAYLLLAGLATPLVVSVHSIVALDFTVAQLPGWHTTFFPPYFVAGAIYSGFAMVLTLVIPLRSIYKLQGIITEKHLDNMARIMLATGLIVFYSYLTEWFYAWYSANEFERAITLYRMTGDYALWYWLLIFCNGVVPQMLWFPQIRRNALVLFIISILVNVGMWLERFIIVVTSLSHDFMPSSWDVFYPTFWDWATFIGTIGFFFTLFLLFIRFLPMINIAEVRHLMHQEQRDRERRQSPPSSPQYEPAPPPSEPLREEPEPVDYRHQPPVPGEA